MRVWKLLAVVLFGVVTFQAAVIAFVPTVATAQRTVNLDEPKTEADFKAAGYIKVPAWLWLETKKDGKPYRIYGFEWVNPRTMKTDRGGDWSWEKFFTKVDLYEKTIASEQGDTIWTKKDGAQPKKPAKPVEAE